LIKVFVEGHYQSILQLTHVFVELSSNHSFELIVDSLSRTPEEMEELSFHLPFIQFAIVPELVPFSIGCIPFRPCCDKPNVVFHYVKSFMAAQIATVVDFRLRPVSLTHGKEILLATTKTQWIHNIELLLEDEQMREFLGVNAKQNILQNPEARYISLPATNGMSPNQIRAAHRKYLRELASVQEGNPNGTNL